jgi:hypothetical protein
VHGPVSGDIDLASADAMLAGTLEREGSGEVLSVGDVNGDGVDDVLIGAPTNPSIVDLPGRAALVYGTR